ncbi:MAG TPA: hypothetical protein VGY76_01475 [Solirubrobacteraceae bacterium]|nr:hypothetical protein [Solirubrobacteraceae bacterium]
MSHVVRSASELMQAVDSGVNEIEVEGTLSGMPMITLQPGVKLHDGILSFGAKGVRLTRDNELEGVTVLTRKDKVAILNDTSVADLGTLTLRGVDHWAGASRCLGRCRGARLGRRPAIDSADVPSKHANEAGGSGFAGPATLRDAPR